VKQRSGVPRLAAMLGTGIVVLGAARSTEAQAWVPSAGAGSIGVAVQRIDHTGHRLTDGTLAKNGRSVNVSVYVNVEYALTDRLVLSGALPYVFGRYSDSEPPPPFIPFLPIDQCRCWNSDAQDFDVTARYNVKNGLFALTPSLSATIPSHAYDYHGEAVVGRHLRELRMAIDAGQRLDVISPRLSVQGQYAYSFVEQVLDIPNNRSIARLGASFRIRRLWSVQGDLVWQRTHGGLRFGSPEPSELPVPGDVTTPELLLEHDRLLRDNSFHGGGTITYQFPKFDVFGSYEAFVSGTDTHAGRAFVTGISWPFELGH
jgi:hypothetical protein